MKILGVMTGTSLDGIDATCIDWGARKPKVLWSKSAQYPNSLRKRVIAIQQKQSDLKVLLNLDRDLGMWYAKTLQIWIKGLPKSLKPEVIANHGQTIAHHPSSQTTLQIGEATWICQATGLTVIDDFRRGDIAQGGQGAPLVPQYHRLLKDLYFPKDSIVFHNLGGISNLTWMTSKTTLALDTGPANLWIDDSVRLITNGKLHFDFEGHIARKGTPDQKALKRLSSHPYLKKKGVKSTGRDDFPFTMLLSSMTTPFQKEDLVATATEYTVQTIVSAYKALGKTLNGNLKIMFCGGGSQNRYLMERLSKELSLLFNKSASNINSVSILPLDQIYDPKLRPLLDSKIIEASAFSYFGLQTLRGVGVGASPFAPSAKITPGRNWSTIKKALSSI